MNEKYPYAYHSLRVFPLVKIEHENREALICPLLTLLFRRVTEGIYYEIYNADNFDIYFGSAYQDYVGGMLKNANKSATLLKEEIYGSSHNKVNTIDWIFGDTSALLFIECKTKRLTIDAKVNLTDLSELEKQFSILADAIQQTYKEILKYKANKYPNIQYQESLEVFPVVVTLEEWFLFGDALMPMLDNAVKEKLKENNLDEKILKDIPYTVCSTDGLNMLATVSRSASLKSIMREKLFDSDKRYWHLDTYLGNKYQQELQMLKTYGENEFNQFIDKQIGENEK